MANVKAKNSTIRKVANPVKRKTTKKSQKDSKPEKIKSTKIIATDKYKIDEYKGTILANPRQGYTSFVTKTVICAVPSNYKIFAFDLTTSFPCKVKRKKSSKYVWIFELTNLHGNGRPIGTYTLEVFREKV